jgi:diguanylate cyclase (GGDEF)-like protein
VDIEHVPDDVTPGPHGDERFRALFEHAPLGVALCEPDGRFADVNTTFREILAGTGIDPDDGTLLDLVRQVDHPDSGADRQDEARAWRDGLAAVRAGTAQVARVQLSVAPPDAPPRWVQATAARVALGDHAYLLAHLEDTTHRHLEQQRLVHLATHDGLTGLANRAMIGGRLEAGLARAAANGLPVGVLYLDLDHFKAVNDELGHDVGDALLIAVAQRLSAVLRAGDAAGRLGGDEFLVVAADVPDEVALAELVRRVETALEQPLSVGGHALPVLASVGAVLSRPGDAAPGLIRRADAAMYAAKRARRRAESRRQPAHAHPNGHLHSTERGYELSLRSVGDDPIELAIVQEQAAVAELRPAVAELRPADPQRHPAEQH